MKLQNNYRAHSAVMTVSLCELRICSLCLHENFTLLTHVKKAKSDLTFAENVTLSGNVLHWPITYSTCTIKHGNVSTISTVNHVIAATKDEK